MIAAALLAAAAAHTAAAAPPLAASPLGATNVVLVANPALALRHCSYQASACPLEAANEDFSFNVVPALNGAPGAFSLQSAGYPTYFLSIFSAATGAAGIVEAPPAADASWAFDAPLAPAPPGATAYTLRSLSAGPWGGALLTKNDTNRAICAYAAPSGDVALVRAGGAPAAAASWVIGPPPPLALVNVSVSATVTNAAVNKLWMGCHSDYGFAETPRGFTANLLYASSFEAGTCAVPAWTEYAAGGAAGSAAAASETAFNAKPSLGVRFAKGAGTEYGVRNRGLCGAGFALTAGAPYEIEIWVWSGGTPSAFVELRDFVAGTVLARADFTVQSTGPSWGSTWIRYNFTLTPSAGTTCAGIPFGSDPAIDCGDAGSPAHVCVRCAGEFVVGLATPDSAVNFGFASLMPGAWGRVAGPDGPLPILKSAGDVLTEMGTTYMRAGGSVSQAMRWKDWRGPVWNRPSQQLAWGASLLSGLGPFEYVDLANALAIVPAITLAYDSNDADDWADLVEYCWGDASTAWGRRRAADGHSRVFNLTHFELGNEQINPNFVDQVIAMEARARAPGVAAPPLFYIFPTNNGLNAEEAARAVAAGLPVERIAPDLHVGAGGAVAAARALFANPPAPGFAQGAVNQETNAGTHDLTRALDEAADLIDFFTADTATTSRIWARAASFCSGTAYSWDDGAWDQGISFFLPNMTWLQPPGHVHAMITKTWAETTLATTGAGAVPFAAQRTADGRSLVLRAVARGAAQPLAVAFPFPAAAGSVATYTLTSAGVGDDNSPGAPDRVAPVAGALPVTAGATSIVLQLPAHSFVVAVVPLQ